MEDRKIHETTVMTPESNTSDDNEPEDTDVKEIISAPRPPGASAKPDYQQTTENTGSQLASLHCRELFRLRDEPMKALGPDPESSTDVQDAESWLETLLAELDTPAVMADQEQQCVLYCQIGDLYRAKLYNLQSALQYYQSMLECSKSLSENIKQAKAHNRLGLTYDMLGKHEEATRSHERVLEICRDAVGDEVDICVAYKNVATSFTLSGKVFDAKTNYKTALRLARETENKIEEMDIHCKLGDLHRVQLKEPHVSHKYYTNMLALTTELRSKYWEMIAYNRLGLACEGMQDNEQALHWSKKNMNMIHECTDKREQIIAHMNVGVLLGRVNQPSPQLDTALQMAQEKGDEYGQMSVYIHMGDMQREKFHSPRAAIQYYEQALALARQLGDRRQEGVAYSRMGLAHLERREYEAAIEWYKKYLTISQEIEDKKDEVTAHAAVGNSYRLLGTTEQATYHFDTALQLAQQTENLHGQMDVYCKMGDMQREQLHSPRTAIQYYEQALALARQLTNSIETASAYERLGLAHYEMGEYEKALRWHQKQLDISKDIGDNRQQIRAHANLGCTYRLMGKLDLATSHYSTALQMAEQTGNQHEQMGVYCKIGDMHRIKLHSPRTAIQYYEQYLPLARQLGDRRQEGVAYNRLGLAHVDMREYETALEWYQKHLKISHEIGDKKDEVTAHTAVGNAYRLLGNIEQATSHFDTALQLAQQTENLHGQMDVYCKMGDLQREQLHSPRTAIQYYEQYLSLVMQSGDRHEEGWAYNRLGDAHVDMREYEAALEWYQKHLKISEEKGERKDEVTVHMAVGNAYRLLGNIEQATSHFDTALQLAQQTENRHGQMGVYFSMGEMQREQLHSPRTAMQYYEQHLALARQLGDRREEVMAYHCLGNVYVNIKEYETALEWHQKHLNLSQESVDKKEQIPAHRNMGEVYRILGKLDQATAYFNTALQLAKETGYLQEEIQVNFFMGDLQREQLHLPRTAIQYYEQALALARQLEDVYNQGVAYSTLGQAYYDMREYQVALEWYQKCLEMLKESGKKTDQIAAHQNMAASCKALGKPDQARSHYQSALSIAIETRNKKQQDDITKKLASL
ncbi:uncharacterized protein LOC144919453 [Branchiostoma floridae x Branchiostoma belcheri]